MRDIILIAIVFAGSFVGLFRPFFGLLFFVFLGIINPHSLTWSFATTFPSSQIVAGATIVGTILSGELRLPPFKREFYIVLALWFVFGASTVGAMHPALAFDYLVYVSKILLMVVFALILTKSMDRLRNLLRVIGLSLGFLGLKGGIFAIVTAGQFIVYGPENSWLEANNSIGLALTMNIPVLYYLLQNEKRAWIKCAIGAMLLFSYPAIVCTYSRGAWLGLAMVSALLILKSRYKFLIVGMTALIAVPLAGALPQLLPQRVVNRYDLLVNYKQDDSAESRLWSWEFCKRVGMANPVTGAGFDFYSIEAYATYYPEFLVRWPGKVWACHSTWFTLLSEHGFPGLFLWIFLLLSCFLSTRQIRLFGKSRAEGAWGLRYSDMLQSSLLAYMIVGSFLDTAYFDLFYYLVVVIVVLKEEIARMANDVPSGQTVRGLEERAIHMSTPHILTIPGGNQCSAAV